MPPSRPVRPAARCATSAATDPADRGTPGPGRLAFAGFPLYEPPQSAGPSWGLNGGPVAAVAEPPRSQKALPPPVSPLSTVSTCAFLPRPMRGLRRRSQRLSRREPGRETKKGKSNGSIRTCVSCPPGPVAAAGRRACRAVQGRHRSQWRVSRPGRELGTEVPHLPHQQEPQGLLHADGPRRARRRRSTRWSARWACPKTCCAS